MTGEDPARDSELLDDLVDSFLEGLRRGEAPTVEAYAAAHPRLAGQIRDLFPALATLERCADSATGDAEPSFPGLEVLDAGDPGVGGMGKVYKARELSLDRVVAVKVTRAHLDTPAGRAFFEGEARAAARLDHPHIVKVFSFQPDHVPPYYVMQYVEGRPLEHACRGRGGRDWQLIAELLEKVARAIHYAHDSGIVHRDIKPANILVDYENEPHVTDFGLAKSVDGLLGKPTGEIEVSSLRGTPHYIAPDLYDGGAANAGTDIYALGITMYVVLTGRPPFSGQTFEELRDAVREADPPVPKDIDPEIPEPLQRICLKAMEPRPDDRYASAQTMAADLQRFAEGREVFARPTRYLRERRGRLQNHLTDIHLLRRQNLIDTREMDRLMRPYHGMLEADSAWDELSRRFPWETALLRLGGWLAVVSGVLWLPWYWDDLVRWQRIAALALPCFLVNLVGWLYLRRGSRLNGTVFLSTGSLLLPLLIGVVLAEYRAVRWPLPESWEVFGADALRPGLGQFVLTNVQINVAVGAFFGYALALLAIIRAKVFGIWVGVGTYIAFSALLLLVGLVHWLNHQQVATALSCYTPVCLLFVPVAGLLRSRAGPGWAAIFYSFFPIPLWLVMTMLARYGGEEWLGAAPEWDAEPVQLWLMANGLLYLAIGLGHARARTGVARFWGEFFMLLVPVSLLVPTNVLFEKAPYLGHAGPHPISLYEWAAFGISVTLVVLGTVLRRGALVAPGLAGFALAILRTTDRHFQDQLAWPLALAGLAGLAMALGAAAAFVRNRRKPGASA